MQNNSTFCIGGGNNLPHVLGRTSSSPAQMAGSGLAHIKKEKKDMLGRDQPNLTRLGSA